MMGSAPPAPRAWNTSDDIEQYRRDVAKFFERIAIASEGNQPPGMNASSGWFLKAAREDPEIKSVLPPGNSGDDPEGQTIFAALASFEAKIIEAFNMELASGSWDKNLGVAWDAFEHLMTVCPRL